MLTRDPIAQNFYRQGVAHREAGQYSLAHEAFDCALNAFPPGAPSTLDEALQWSEIVREDGIADLYAAVNGNDSSLLEWARQAIESSMSVTGPLVSAQQSFDVQPPQDDKAVEAGIRRLFAAHGESIHSLSRLAIARQVIEGKDTHGTDARAAKIRSMQRHLGLAAHEFLRLGDDGNALVGNAMDHARQEVLNGRRKRVAGWLGRAAYGLGWTLVRDPRHFVSAARTFGSRIPELRSYKAARTSVRTRP